MKWESGDRWKNQLSLVCPLLQIMVSIMYQNLPTATVFLQCKDSVDLWAKVILYVLRVFSHVFVITTGKEINASFYCIYKLAWCCLAVYSGRLWASGLTCREKLISVQFISLKGTWPWFFSSLIFRTLWWVLNSFSNTCVLVNLFILAHLRYNFVRGSDFLKIFINVFKIFKILYWMTYSIFPCSLTSFCLH